MSERRRQAARLQPLGEGDAQFVTEAVDEQQTTILLGLDDGRLVPSRQRTPQGGGLEGKGRPLEPGFQQAPNHVADQRLVRRGSGGQRLARGSVGLPAAGDVRRGEVVRRGATEIRADLAGKDRQRSEHLRQGRETDPGPHPFTTSAVFLLQRKNTGTEASVVQIRRKAQALSQTGFIVVVEAWPALAPDEERQLAGRTRTARQVDDAWMVGRGLRKPGPDPLPGALAAT